MGINRSPRAFVSRLSTVLMLVALLMRATVPQGWMPNVDAFADGSPIIICSSTGQAHILVGEDGQPLPAGQQDQDAAAHQPPCAFSAIAGLSLPLGSFILTLPSSHAFEHAMADARAPAVARRLSPAEARGPPLQA